MGDADTRDVERIERERLVYLSSWLTQRTEVTKAMMTWSTAGIGLVVTIIANRGEHIGLLACGALFGALYWFFMCATLCISAHLNSSSMLMSVLKMYDGGARQEADKCRDQIAETSRKQSASFISGLRFLAVASVIVALNVGVTSVTASWHAYQSRVGVKDTGVAAQVFTAPRTTAQSTTAPQSQGSALPASAPLAK